MAAAVWAGRLHGGFFVAKCAPLNDDQEQTKTKAVVAARRCPTHRIKRDEWGTQFALSLEK
jgi:hypothetical protein